MYDYNAKVVAVIDGDTVTLDIDLGFGVRRIDKFRLYGPDVDARDGMNAPEMNTPEGKAARQFLFDLVGESPIVTVKTVRDRREKFGRDLAVLFTSGIDGRPTNVNQMMIDAGHAKLQRY